MLIKKHIDDLTMLKNLLSGPVFIWHEFIKMMLHSVYVLLKQGLLMLLLSQRLLESLNPITKTVKFYNFSTYVVILLHFFVRIDLVIAYILETVLSNQTFHSFNSLNIFVPDEF